MSRLLALRTDKDVALHKKLRFPQNAVPKRLNYHVRQIVRGTKPCNHFFDAIWWDFHKQLVILAQERLGVRGDVNEIIVRPTAQS